ncbi:MAG TPA: S8 family serine peptidase [Caulobacteraceae bacterium]|nr:S8 family serine peptidase [Caulobacteraceae bacterium]
MAGLWIAGLLLLALGFWLLTGRMALAEAPAADPQREVLVLLKMPPEHYSAQSAYGGSYGGGEARGARRRFAEGRARANGLILVDDWPMPMAGLDCYIMAVPDGRSTQAVADQLSHDPGIAWAEPMNTYTAQGAATGAAINDPLYRVQPDAAEWRLDDLHRIATGRDIRVAIIDSAVDRNHPDLAGQVVVSENFVPGAFPAAESHGTGVAGIIAAVAGNGKGIVGVAPHARLMALRACRQGETATTCDSLSLAKAIYYAVEHDADIINMSLSGPDDPLLGNLLDLARQHGATIVAAFDPAAPGGGFPASHRGVVAVIDEGAEPAGAGVFGAPGRDIPTTQPDGGWFFVNGSSFAAAHVSGLFALLREKTHKPQSGAALVTVAGSDAVDPQATLRRVTGAGALAAAASPARP